MPAIRNLFWLLPLSFYGLTASPGIGWLDSAMLVNSIFLLKTGSWVNNHNMFLYAGRLWTLLLPLENVAYSLNLLAALFGALTVHFIFRTGLLLTGRLLPSVLGALGLMFSHSLWWHSTSLEVYTLNTLLLALMLFLVVRYEQQRSLSDLYGALFCFGLGVSNHVLMGLFLFSFLALLVLPRERALLWRRQVFALALACVLLGAQLWITLFFEDVVRKLNEIESYGEQTLEAKLSALSYTLWRATGGRFQDRMFDETVSTTDAWGWRANYVFLLCYNYPSIVFPLGLLGAISWARDAARRTSFVFFAVGITVQALWSSNYFIWDMYAFGLPVWVMFGLLSLVGFDRALSLGGRARIAVLVLSPTLLIAPLLYAQIPRMAKQPGVVQDYFSTQTASLFSAADYFGNPNKRNYRRAEHLVAAYGRTLPEGAHLWDSDSKGYYPFRMYYQRVLGHRPDVESHLVFSGFLDINKAREHAVEMKRTLEAGKPVYVSSLTYPERVVLGELYRLLEPSAPPPRVLREMPDEQFTETFPRYRIEAVPLKRLRSAHIYRVVPR